MYLRSGSASSFFLSCAKERGLASKATVHAVIVVRIGRVMGVDVFFIALVNVVLFMNRGKVAASCAPSPSGSIVFS